MRYPETTAVDRTDLFVAEGEESDGALELLVGASGEVVPHQCRLSTEDDGNGDEDFRPRWWSARPPG